MQISSATMIATQNTTATPRTNDPAADFAPLVFKKSAPAAAPQTAVAQSAANGPAARQPVQPGAQTQVSPGNGYVRPGTNLDIKV